MITERLCDYRLLKGPDIPALDAAFDAVMERKDSHVFFRDEHVLDYGELLAEIDPTVVVAWRVAKDSIAVMAPSLADFKASVENLTTLFVGPRFFNQPFAENHAHLGGIAGDDLVLAHLVLVGAHASKGSDSAEKNEGAWGNANVDKEKQSPEHAQLKRLRRIHRLRDAFIAMWKSVDALGPSSLEGYERVLAEACDDANSVFASPALDWVVQDDGLVIADAVGDARWIFKQLAGAARTGNYQHAWMWLFVLLWKTYRAPTAPATIRAAALLLVADIMVLRRELIMDGSGLRRFTTNYFLPVLRRIVRRDSAWKTTSHMEAARRVFATSGDTAELKIAARDFRKSLTKVFAEIVKRRIESLRSVPESGSEPAPERSALDHWHFCLHLTRVDGEPRYRRRKALWDEARELKKLLGSQSKWDIAPFLGGGGVSMSQFTPARFVRGLDVAGDETAWPISIFAPMLRWIRLQETVKNPMGAATVPTFALHLSIHAGEDYKHPLSGLRHVDETVRFCGMRKGDRLGHALALGISPEEWFRRQSTVFLAVDEHVDNLVWAWHEAGELIRTKQLEVAQRVLERLAQRIDRFLPHVSWLPHSPGAVKPSLQALHEAWLLRRNCCYQVLNQQQDIPVGDSTMNIGAPDLDVINAQIDQPDNGVGPGLYVNWARHERDAIARGDEESIIVCLVGPSHASRGRLRLESRGPDENLQMYDHDDEDDLRFMLALQDACIERYALAGLAIETNPSSNIYVGQIETYDKHPIYRWDPLDAEELHPGGSCNQFGIRTIPIPVTINTDDQGIIPTTLRMEHHLIHEAALNRGYTLPLADAWIEKLRALGVQHFDSTHELPQHGA
ncbi:hypothetical protein DF039_00220 [Burkholderia cenocepacia]|nr:hypothetical protein DF039_00220 [Burkholderia cenocepacia]